MLDQRRVTGRRVVAFVIDTVVGFGVFWGLVVALGTEIARQPATAIGRPSGATTFMRFETIDDGAYAELMGTAYHLDGGTVSTVFLVAMAYWIGMFVVVQGLTGRTLGKFFVGICTVDSAGRPCGIGRAAARWLLLVVDAFPYIVPMLVGFVATVSSERRQRVGDRVAKTWVVSVDALGEPIPDAPVRTQSTRTPADELPPPDWP
jgi:uncharacterized RDD family membrane protein YckC